MDRRSSVARFTYEVPSLDSYWRAIILFGRNVASYKFALGAALLELGTGNEVVTLEDLAIPFARRVASHVREHDKQGTSGRSRFLDACRAFNRNELDEEALRATSVKLGFSNVIDAFHVVDKPMCRSGSSSTSGGLRGGIRLTDQLRTLLVDGQGDTLTEEVESRWHLVETAWELNRHCCIG